jgi:tetratricopeptide (TPR) repeat protein
MTLTDGDVSFGTLVKTFRRRRRRTQQHLADALGVHRSTLFRWERGDCLPESKAQVLELACCLVLDDQETRQLLEASLTALSPYWHVPLPRNPYFTGREEILELLHAQLGVEQIVALTQSSALHGLGGVGKTQIALEYAYRHSLEYSAVFWIAAETDEQLVGSLLHIAEVLQVPEREQHDKSHVLAAVGRWFVTHSQWLLIWDNVEDLEMMQRFLPNVRQGALLITTRCQALGTLARGLDILPLPHEDALLLVLRRAKVLSPEAQPQQLQQLAQRQPELYAAATELVTELGGLPLALDQAGAYLEETRCTFSSYLDIFRTRRATVLKLRGECSYDHPASVSTTFLLALRATVELHPAIFDLLRVCALVSPDAIPEELFHKGGEHLGAALTACRDPLEWDRLLAMACRYSLLSRQPEAQTLSIHRLVQAVMLDLMTEEEREQWEERVITALDMVLPEVFPEGKAALWKQCERLLPHIQLRIQHTGEACQLLPLASLAYKTGSFLRLHVRDAEAEPLFLRALSIQEQVLGPSHPKVASSLNNVAILSFNQGRYAEAEPLFGRAVSIQERALGPLHPEVAASLNNLAYLFREQGKYTEAEPLFERSLAIREHALGPSHPLVANSLKNLADLYQVQGNYAQAEQVVRRALAIQEQALGHSHPQMVRALDTLANLLREQGKYIEAELLYQRGLSIWDEHFGPAYPRRAMLLDDLAECYRLQARDAEAEQFYQQALTIWEQRLGPSNLNVTISLHGLANLARDHGQHLEAEQLYQRALALREQQLGSSHPDIAQVLHDLAISRQQQGKMEEAHALAERALSIRQQSLGDVHPQTISTRILSTQLAETHMNAKEHQRALEHAVPHDTRLSPAEEGREALLPSSAGLTSERECDPFETFLAAHCEMHPYAWCHSRDLWQAYERWVEERQERYPLSRWAFTAQLKVRGCRADRTNAVRIWRGIALVKDRL